MADDIRLNIETERFNDEVQHHQHNPQPSKDPPTIPQILLKETSHKNGNNNNDKNSI